MYVKFFYEFLRCFCFRVNLEFSTVRKNENINEQQSPEQCHRNINVIFEYIDSSLLCDGQGVLTTLNYWSPRI